MPGLKSSRRRWLFMPATTLVIFSLLLFARLGYHPLWDDEANIGLIAQSVWRTGDTGAVVGQNVVACRNGGELRGVKERFMPPFQYYLATPFVAVNSHQRLRRDCPLLCAAWPRFASWSGGCSGQSPTS